MWWTPCSPTRTSLPATGSFLRDRYAIFSLRSPLFPLSLSSKQRSDILNRFHRLSLSCSLFSSSSLPHFSSRLYVPFELFRGQTPARESRGDLRGIETDSEIVRASAARSSCRLNFQGTIYRDAILQFKLISRSQVFLSSTKK